MKASRARRTFAAIAVAAGALTLAPLVAGAGSVAQAADAPASGAPATDAPATAEDRVAAASRASLDVVILVDTSDRVLGAPLNTAQDVATAYIGSMPPEVRVGVVTYGQFPTTMYPLSTSRSGSVGAIGAVTSEGKPALYDGLAFAAGQFDVGSPSRRQIVVVGPGLDEGSDASIDAALAAVRRMSIRVDAIVVDAPGTTSENVDLIAGQSDGSRTQWSDAAGLTALAQRTLTWSRPPPEVVAAAVAAAAPPPKPSIFANKLFLLVGGSLVFASLAFLLITATAQRVKRVDLTGLSVSEVDKKGGKGAGKAGAKGKSSATPIGGIAQKITTVTEKALEKQTRARGLGVSLERAGINLKPGEFLIVSACVMLGIFAVLTWMKGILIAAPISLVLTAIGPRKWVARKASKRSAAFGDQLSDTLQLLSSSLRAGQGLMQAVDSVAKEGDAPASDEFRRVVTEVRLGRDLIDSLRAMADRVRSEDFNWVIPAIEINREVGGDLAEVLDTVAGTIRDRADIRRQVKTLSAEGRLSAYVLLSLPVGIAGFIQMSNPDYLVELQTSPGYFLAGAAILMMIIGGVWLFKLCKIEF